MINSVWYHNLIKPMFSPPDWLFTPVWAVLYLTILASLVLYSFKKEDNKLQGYIYFAIQIVLNILWTPVFFGLKNILLGLIVILALDIFVFLTIRKFYSISKPAGIILIPYFLWILFATYLNFAYLILN